MTTIQTTQASETEIPEKASRRRFTKEYKLRILEATDRCDAGEVGKLLRREGLYSSHLSTWRAARREGTLRALGRKRGPKKKKKTAEQVENEKLRRENECLRKKLAHAEKIIDVQKKLSEVLGIPLEDESDANERD